MLEVQSIHKSFKASGWLTGKPQKVLHDVSLHCLPGECLGIIGESGSGKSTLGRLILGLDQPDSGKVLFEGQPVSQAKVRRGNMSAVFQNYTSSMNPYFTVREALLEPFGLQSRKEVDRERRMKELLFQVGLSPAYLNKAPHELSGGEAQRVCIARAISTQPKLIVMDEAVSSLDGSVQLQVLELLKGLHKQLNTAYIFITHDIQAAAFLCDRILVFRQGRIEENLHVSELQHAQSDYTRTLLSMSMY
ncbi:ABC transporter ATP-binding protein [Paenibacillus sp. JSM ZJ436]|uniref:ABC transporter ATP-binding protein n=1 Tax=Paenibacillus sp. JSM ZJ436 TaxID=3376190 RepID=UPI00378A8029